MPFPSPPWDLRGEMWVSTFAVRSSGRADRRAGLYGAAVVDYREGGVLTYHELLVARLASPPPGTEITITDIWVDSEISMQGGRSLWAIPKGLAEVEIDDSGGPVFHTTASTSLEGDRVASASFRGVRLPGPALPFAFRTVQPRAGGLTRARVTGKARVQACLGRWSFAPDGPLGFLAGRPALASWRMSDFRISFGG